MWLSLFNSKCCLNGSESKKCDWCNKRHNSPRVAKVSVHEISTSLVPPFPALVHVPLYLFKFSITIHGDIFGERWSGSLFRWSIAMSMPSSMTVPMKNTYDVISLLAPTWRRWKATRFNNMYSVVSPTTKVGSLSTPSKKDMSRSLWLIWLLQLINIWRVMNLVHHFAYKIQVMTQLIRPSSLGLH